MTKSSLDYGGGAGVPAARSSGDSATVRLFFVFCVYISHRGRNYVIHRS
jgi:hypothetical protein